MLQSERKLLCQSISLSVSLAAIAGDMRTAELIRAQLYLSAVSWHYKYFRLMHFL